METLSVLTGSTCGDACWHAHKEVCRCSCGGLNHGILTKGGAQPSRTCKIESLYELVAVIPGRADSEDWSDVFKRIDSERKKICDERFPGIDEYGYGAFRPEKYLPVLDRKISATQSKWPEVQAVHNAIRLIWARPLGTKYLIRGPNHQSIYNLAA